MPKLRVLPFADTGTDFDKTEGWIDIEVKDEYDALTWCCNHAGLIDCAMYGIHFVRLVDNGYIDFDVL